MENIMDDKQSNTELNINRVAEFISDEKSRTGITELHDARESSAEDVPLVVSLLKPTAAGLRELVDALEHEAAERRKYEREYKKLVALRTTHNRRAVHRRVNAKVKRLRLACN